MPYKRSYGKKRFYKKRNGNGKNGFEKRVVSIIHKQIEKKSKLFGMASTEITTVGFAGLGDFFQDISFLDRGTAAWQRIGNRINPQYLQMNYQILRGDTTNVVRMILFQWHKDSSTQPLLSDLFMAPNAPVDNVYSVYARHMKFVTILYDKVFALGTTTRPQVVGKVNISLAKMRRKTLYNDSLVTGTGHLFIVCIGDSLLPVHPEFTMQAKFVYRDG